VPTMEPTIGIMVLPTALSTAVGSMSQEGRARGLGG
jgi:hypothetical protein